MQHKVKLLIILKLFLQQTYDENHVIGFGYDGTEWGTNGKLKLALFDISDLENPREKFPKMFEEIDSQETISISQLPLALEVVPVEDCAQ